MYGDGRAISRHQKSGNMRFTWENVGVLYLLSYVIQLTYVSKFAVHYTKLLRKNGQCGGGKRGVSYILIRFMIQDSESTRLRTKGPGGLLTTNY